MAGWATALVGILLLALGQVGLYLVQRTYHRRLTDRLKGQHRRTLDELARARRADWDAVNLVAVLQPRTPLPPPGAWAAPTDFLALLVRIVLADRPRLVVELGSGLSTVVLGLALQRCGGGRLISIEHEASFAERTLALLKAHALEEVAAVRVAPLTAAAGSGVGVPWYERSILDDLGGVDLLVVDGPPAPIAPDIRYPALPFFWERLSPGATVLLDDAARPGERAVAERWRAEFAPAMERLDLERGALLLRKRG